MSNPTNFAKRIRALRGSELSRNQFAIRLDIHRQNISRWESGTSVPTAPQIINLHEVTGVSLNWLLLGKGPMYFR